MTIEEEIAALKRIAAFHREDPEGYVSDYMFFTDKMNKLNQSYGGIEYKIKGTLDQVFYASNTSTGWYSLSDTGLHDNWSPKAPHGLHYGEQLVKCLACREIKKGLVEASPYSNSAEVYVEQHYHAGPHYCGGSGRKSIAHPCRCRACGTHCWAVDGFTITEHNCAERRCYCHAQRNSHLPR